MVNLSQEISSKIIIPKIKIADFYAAHAEYCQLKLLSGATGMQKLLHESAVNRLGMALTGFYKHFAHRRIQIVGKSEQAYMLAMSSKLLRKRIREIFSKKIPCIIFARGIHPHEIILEESEKHAIPVFSSAKESTRLLNSVTISLSSDFAATCSEHGCMVDIQGIGVLIRGESGIGKSECVLGLLEQGYSLVADDITRFKYVDGWELIGSSSDLTRNYMEVRGIGIINVASMFGASSIRPQKRLDLVVTLKDWHKMEQVDRIGLDPQFYEVLKIKIPHVIIPVRAGRDVAGLVEVAAMNQKLKMMGQDSATEFNQRLMLKMQEQSS